MTIHAFVNDSLSENDETKIDGCSGEYRRRFEKVNRTRTVIMLLITSLVTSFFKTGERNVKVVRKKEASAFERKEENTNFSERLWEKPIFLEKSIS